MSRHKTRAQSPVEFIIVVFLFLIIIIALFTTFITKLHPEMEKAIEQKSCMNANGLATYLLKEPGVPAGWTPANLQIFGLTNGTDDDVSYQKWLTAEGMGYAEVEGKAIPDAVFLIGYNILAFNPNMAETCSSADESAVICRISPNIIRVSAASTPPATLNMKLYLPGTTASIANSGSLEGDDSVATASDSGTVVTAELGTDGSDSDAFDITFASAPKLVFVQNLNYKTAGSADIHIYVGNTSAVESFGSAGTGANSYCKAERAASLVAKNGEIFPARFSILAW